MTGWIRRVRLDRRSQQAFNIILAPRLSVEVRQIDISGCEMRCHIDHRLQCGFGFAELTQLSQSGPGVKQSLLSIGIDLLREYEALHAHDLFCIASDGGDSCCSEGEDR